MKSDSPVMAVAPPISNILTGQTTQLDNRVLVCDLKSTVSSFAGLTLRTTGLSMDSFDSTPMPALDDSLTPTVDAELLASPISPVAGSLLGSALPHISNETVDSSSPVQNGVHPLSGVTKSPNKYTNLTSPPLTTIKPSESPSSGKSMPLAASPATYGNISPSPADRKPLVTHSLQLDATMVLKRPTSSGVQKSSPSTRGSNGTNNSSLNQSSTSSITSATQSIGKLSKMVPPDVKPPELDSGEMLAGSVTGKPNQHENGKTTSNASGRISTDTEDHGNNISVIRRPSMPNECVIVIREVYENGLATEYFAMQLDYALESDVHTIVIEPSRLGRETAQWLTIGNLLRRSALATGALSLMSGAMGRDSFCIPLGVAATAMSAVYVISWRPDPCSRYRVERNTRRLQRLPLHDVTCTAPVVLVKCDHMLLRNGVCDSVSIASLALCIWRLYNWYLIT